MKLSELKNEEAIKAFAKLLTPIGKIMANEENKKAQKKGKMDFIQTMIENNASEVKDIFAILNGKNPAEYECNFLTVAADLLDLINDPIMTELFFSAGQKQAETSCS